MNLIHNNSWVTPVARVCGAAVFALSLLLAWGLSPVAQAADTDLFNLANPFTPLRTHMRMKRDKSADRLLGERDHDSAHF